MNTKLRKQVIATPFFQMLQPKRNCETPTLQFSCGIKFCTLVACVQIPILFNAPDIVLKFRIIRSYVIVNT